MIKEQLPGVVLSITWDRGRELMRHQDITRATGVLIFFCKPKSPWQRGTNENTNGVLRRRHPKGTNFADVTHQVVRETQIWLEYPPDARTVLGYTQRGFHRDGSCTSNLNAPRIYVVKGRSRNENRLTLG